MPKFARTLAAVLMAVPGIAQAAEPACLTTAEFSSLAGYAMPSVIGGTTKRCTQALGPKAFLPANGSKLAERYAANKASAWPGAKAAFLKLSADKDKQVNDVFTKLPDDTLQEMLDVILEGMVSQEIPLEKCGTIDDFARLLAPLPAQNTAELVALLASLASSDKPAKVGKISLCQK